MGVRLSRVAAIILGGLLPVATTLLPTDTTMASWSLVAALGIGAAVLSPATGRLPRPLLIAVSAAVAAFLVSALLAATPLLSLVGRYPRYEGLVTVVGYALALGVGARLLGVCAPEAHRLWFTSSMAVAALVNLAACLVQLGTAPGSRLIGLLGNSSILGNWALIALLLLGWQWLGDHRKLWLAGMTASAIVLLLAGSRASLVAGAAFLLAAPLVSRMVRQRRGERWPAWWWGPIAAGVMTVAAFAIPTTGSRLTGATPFSSATIHGRLLLWQDTLPLIAASPILGVGPSRFVDALGAFNTPEWAAEVGPYAPPDSPHNLILQVLASAGALGLAAFLAVVILVVVSLWRRRPWDHWQAGAVSALLAVATSYQFSFTDPATTTVALTIVGGALADRVTESALARWHKARAAATIAWLIAAVTLAGSALSAETRYSAALNSAHPDANALVAAADTRPWDPDLAIRIGSSIAALAEQARVSPQPGIPMLTRACTQIPFSTQCRLTLGDLQTLSGDPASAITTLHQALGDDPSNVDVWLKLGIAQAEAGDAASAENSFKTASALRPSAPEPWQDLAALYRRIGRVADGDTAAARAEQLQRR